MRKIPLPICSDAYTVSGHILASDKAKELSVYNLTNRRSPQDAFPQVAQDSRMIMYGLSDFIESYMLEPITHEDIDQAVEFMKNTHAFGGGLHFPELLWRRVVREYNGYLPLLIEGIPEGACFYPNEPFVQVTAKDGFGELAAHIEPLLVGMVSNATARVSLERHLLEMMLSFVERDFPDNSERNQLERAQNLIHDFGMRASVNEQESNLLGRCHLLCFNGTDTFNAAFTAKKQGAANNVGVSIHALAHRIVQGHEFESDAYQAALRSDGKIASYVADCYNYKAAVNDYLIPIAKQSKKIIVVRPDSGDYEEQIVWTVRRAKQEGLCELRDGRVHATNLKILYGDSVNPAKIRNIYNKLWEMDCAPTTWCMFGIGGYLRNTPNRDSLSSAYKLSAMGNDLEPVVKLSEIKEKMSIPGPIVFRGKHPRAHRGTKHQRFALHHYYIARQRTDPSCDCPVNFQYIRNRCIQSFNEEASIVAENPKFGLNRETLTNDIKGIQDKFYAKHKPS